MNNLTLFEQWADEARLIRGSIVHQLCQRAWNIQQGIIDDMTEQRDKAQRARRHTQEWYSRHYGKLEDWARKRLPEPWVNEFFSCIANGSWGMNDNAPPVKLADGTKIVPTNYFRVDTAEGQLILDQTRRAEDAETKLAELRQACKDTLEEVQEALRTDEPAALHQIEAWLVSALVDCNDEPVRD